MIVSGARSVVYGSVEDSFEKIASIWSGYIEAKTGVVGALDAADVARMMVLFKLARDLGPVPIRDNLVDSHGYLICLGNLTGRNSESNSVDPVGAQYSPADVALQPPKDGGKAAASTGKGRKRPSRRRKGK